jgi:hypothetical protein
MLSKFKEHTDSKYLKDSSYLIQIDEIIDLIAQ